MGIRKDAEGGKVNILKFIQTETKKDRKYNSNSLIYNPLRMNYSLFYISKDFPIIKIFKH